MDRAMYSCTRPYVDDYTDASQVSFAPFDVPHHLSRCKLDRFTESHATSTASRFTTSPEVALARSEDAISGLWSPPKQFAQHTQEKRTLWSPGNASRCTARFTEHQIVDVCNEKAKYHDLHAFTDLQNSDSAGDVLASTWSSKSMKSGTK
jgi:hypothetical protein